MSQTTNLFTKFYTNVGDNVSIRCALDCEGISIDSNSSYHCYIVISPDSPPYSMESSNDHDFMTDAYYLIKGESNNLSLPDTIIKFDSELLNNIKEVNEGIFWVRAFPFQIGENGEEVYLTPSQSVELNIEDVIDAKLYAALENSNLTITVEFNDNLQYYDLDGTDWNYTITFFNSENNEISNTQGVLDLIDSENTYVISDINLPEGTKHFSFNLNGIHEDWIYNEDASTIYCNVDIYCSVDLLVQGGSIGTFSKDKFKIKVTLLSSRWRIDAYNGTGSYKVYHGYSWSMNPNGVTWTTDFIPKSTSTDMGIALSRIPKPDKPLQFLHFKVSDANGKIAYATFQNNNILQCAQMSGDNTLEYKYEIKKDNLPSILIKPKYKNFNMLFIGNSFCSAFPDELKGIAEYDNVFIGMYSIYKAGCYLWEHEKYWKEQTRAYKFHYYPTSNIKNRITYTNFNINDCLNFKNKWHHISLQGHFGFDWMTNSEAYKEVITNDSDYPLDNGKTRLQAELDHANYLYGYLQNYPTSEKAKLYWNETWSYDVGWNKVDGQDYVQSVGNQKIQYNNIKYVSEKICKQSPYPKFAPCGDAWQIARQIIFGDLPDTDTSVSDVKHLLTYESDNGGDRYHDGQEGGGEYLNGCVWYEILTGNDCRGNMWIPPYEMTNSRFLLQEAAHEAVLALK